MGAYLSRGKRPALECIYRGPETRSKKNLYFLHLASCIWLFSFILFAVYLCLYCHPWFQQSIGIFYAYLYPECSYIRPSPCYIPLSGKFAFSADFNDLARKFSIRQGRCCYHCPVAQPYLSYDCLFNINPCPDVFKVVDGINRGAGINNLAFFKCLIYDNAVYWRDYLCIF